MEIFSASMLIGFFGDHRADHVVCFVQDVSLSFPLLEFLVLRLSVEELLDVFYYCNFYILFRAFIEIFRKKNFYWIFVLWKCTSWLIKLLQQLANQILKIKHVIRCVRSNFKSFIIYVTPIHKGIMFLDQIAGLPKDKIKPSKQTW